MVRIAPIGRPVSTEMMAELGSTCRQAAFGCHKARGSVHLSKTNSAQYHNQKATGRPTKHVYVVAAAVFGGCNNRTWIHSDPWRWPRCCLNVPLAGRDVVYVDIVHLGLLRQIRHLCAVNSEHRYSQKCYWFLPLVP